MYFKKTFSTHATTLCGLGHLPMSGTLASALTALVWFALPAPMLITQLSIVAGIAVVGFFTTQTYLATTEEIDPREIVIDEVVGMSVALMGASHSWLFFLMTFFFFRLFDILKPFPINRCEQLPDVWGVLSDDIVAGIAALIATHGVRMLVTFLR